EIPLARRPEKELASERVRREAEVARRHGDAERRHSVAFSGTAEKFSLGELLHRGVKVSFAALGNPELQVRSRSAQRVQKRHLPRGEAQESCGAELQPARPCAPL